MCQFLSLDLKYALKCPVDKDNRTVTVQAYPQLRGHSLDVVECDGKSRVEQFTCGKACRGLLESGEFWQRIYPESATFASSQ
jgi:hypothetical protein